MMRSMLADQPYCEVTMQHGEDTIRLETTTFSTFLSRMFYKICQYDLFFKKKDNFRKNRHKYKK